MRSLSLPRAAENRVPQVHAGQIIPYIGASKAAPRAFGLLTFVTIAILVNYVFADKLIPHFNVYTCCDFLNFEK